MARQIYACNNPPGYGLAGGKLVMTPGICAGMTAIWCLKMDIGLPLDQTKPGLQESIVAQFDYELHGQRISTLLQQFLRRARLVLDREGVWNGNGKKTAAVVMAEGDGCSYLWGYPGHSIGAACRGGNYYVFNPDRGLTELEDKKEFKAHMEADYADKILVDKWWLIRVKADPAQREFIRGRVPA